MSTPGIAYERKCTAENVRVDSRSGMREAVSRWLRRQACDGLILDLIVAVDNLTMPCYNIPNTSPCPGKEATDGRSADR